MREIKFRCWYNQTMYEWKNIVSIEGNFLPNPMICLNKVETGRSDQNVLLSEVQLMQYTGLKDKDGKEIYEGDIVRISGKSHIFAAVEDHDDWLCVIEWDKDGWMGSGFAYAEQGEVIGNIYENPELLEAKEI